MVVSRANIAKHLESSSTDPFTGTPLLLDQIEVDIETANALADWRGKHMAVCSDCGEPAPLVCGSCRVQRRCRSHGRKACDHCGASFGVDRAAFRHEDGLVLVN